MKLWSVLAVALFLALTYDAGCIALHLEEPLNNGSRDRVVLTPEFVCDDSCAVKVGEGLCDLNYTCVFLRGG